jgi:hypothetical protein
MTKTPAFAARGQRFRRRICDCFYINILLAVNFGTASGASKRPLPKPAFGRRLASSLLSRSPARSECRPWLFHQDNQHADVSGCFRPAPMELGSSHTAPR